MFGICSFAMGCCHRIVTCIYIFDDLLSLSLVIIIYQSLPRCCSVVVVLLAFAWGSTCLMSFVTLFLFTFDFFVCLEHGYDRIQNFVTLHPRHCFPSFFAPFAFRDGRLSHFFGKFFHRNFGTVLLHWTGLFFLFTFPGQAFGNAFGCPIGKAIGQRSLGVFALLVS